ncbi:AAA family ATPase, partial [Leyella stercorea]|uniref:AAA family ATPase n=1 Tax=Leyella stercorea TaxID=363265 RepID=UPI003AF412AB
LGGANYADMDALKEKLGRQLNDLESEYGVVRKYKTLPVRFETIIEAAYRKTGRQVVILVDEYDKPVIDNLDRPELRDKIREELRGFYGVMKSKDGCIRLGFLTGVTKIGKMSVFSDLNNPKDISMDARYTDICGVSETDLTDCFAESVRELAEANGLSEEECRQKLALMYDGYHFCEDSTGVYNPFSLLNTFDSLKFREYWFETGTPSFLVKVMRKTSYDVTRLSSDLVGSSLLSDVNTAFLNPVPLLYQSGYLTIKGFDPRFNLYTLGFPNMEVKDGFLNFLLGYYAPIQSDSTNTLISLMSMDVESGNPEGFMTRLDALFARTNYQIQGDCEKDFQYAMYIIIELMG